MSTHLAHPTNAALARDKDHVEDRQVRAADVAAVIGTEPWMFPNERPSPATSEAPQAPTATTGIATRAVDPGPGVLLLPLAAILLMVCDVIVVGAVDSLWVLIPAVVFDLLVIFVLAIAILRLLAHEGDDPQPGGGPSSSLAAPR
jgi:hypothetical protein